QLPLQRSASARSSPSASPPAMAKVTRPAPPAPNATSAGSGMPGRSVVVGVVAGALGSSARARAAVETVEELRPLAQLERGRELADGRLVLAAIEISRAGLEVRARRVVFGVGARGALRSEHPDEEREGQEKTWKRAAHAPVILTSARPLQKAPIRRVPAPAQDRARGHGRVLRVRGAARRPFPPRQTRGGGVAGRALRRLRG